MCIDPYEAAIEEKRGRKWSLHSPFESVAGKQIRAVSRKGVHPQAYISRNEADDACRASHKRLCREEEWIRACKGRSSTRYPYGNDHKGGYCNDAGVSPLNHYYGAAGGVDPSAYGWGPMNDPRLNQLPGSLARTGAFRKCTNGFRVFDMVGNLHEWVDDPAGTFRGGYYLDTRINGEGCDYHTVAHNADYHDYSTGFRCCADLR
jgi:formylglycine-generating enzyme required for sulfatase activity